MNISETAASRIGLVEQQHFMLQSGADHEPSYAASGHYTPALS